MKTICVVAMVLLCGALAPAAGPRRFHGGSFSSSAVMASAAGAAATPALAGFAYADADASDSRSPEEIEGGKEKPDDPGYTLYKDGYSLILDEDWKGARKKFAALISSYPKSEYRDDAEYWSAYAMKGIDRKKAIKEYKDFIAKYPKSTYFDDAVADLSSLTGRHRVELPGGMEWPSSSVYKIDSSDASSWVVTSPGVAPKAWSYGSGKGKGYGYSYSTPAPAMRKLNRELNRMSSTIDRATMANIDRAMHNPALKHLPGMSSAVVAPRVHTNFNFNFWPNEDDENLDPKTRVKMEALRALGDTREDSLSFKTLRDVAVDTHQPKELRLTALDALSNFHNYDVLPVFIQVAKTDTAEDIQNNAIDVISNLTGEKDRAVDALIDLFNSLPKSRKDQRETIFYTIADIGNDKAVDFLAQVAKSSDDEELRTQAIFYLGNIGGEKARAALYSILKEN